MGCCGETTRVETAKINGRTVVNPEVDGHFDGPVKSRSCRDVVFLIIFIAFCVGGMIYLIVAYNNGNVMRLVSGNDKYGNICGYNNEKLFDLPQSGKDYRNMPSYDLLNEECVPDCASQVSVGLFCLPVNLTSTNMALAGAGFNTNTFREQTASFFSSIGRDIQESWREIVYIILIGLVFSIVMVLLLRFLAPILVWVTVGIMVLGSIALTIFTWVLYFQKKEQETVEGDATRYLVAAVFATIFTVIVLVLLIALRKKIALVITLFKEAGKAIAAVPFMLLIPLYTILIMSVVCIVSVAGLVIISAAAEPELQSDSTVTFKKIPLIEYLRFYHIFGFFWVTQFVIACQHISVAGAVSTWFFTRNKKNLGWPILKSIRNLILYHLGSAALGALIIAIVQMLRYLLKSLQKKSRRGNKALSSCLCACQCCLGCFEKFLKFLSRNAYIEIAIYGHGFCKSAQKAFQIITANAFRVTAINFVGDFVLLMAKLAILVPTGFIGYKILEPKENIEYLFVPLILGLAGVWLIAHCCISIYEMTIDTLFVCFCEDCNMNDGISKPYFMSRGLMKFVENSKKALEQLESQDKTPKIQGGDSGTQVQVVGSYYDHQMGSSQFPSQMPTPQHHPSGVGMSPLHPAYKPVSEPPSPRMF